MPLDLKTLPEQLQLARAWDLAMAYIYDKKSMTVKVADIYDDDAELRDALSTLMPDFEYPDISYLKLGELRRRCRRMSNPYTMALKEQSMDGALPALQKAVQRSQPD